MDVSSHTTELPAGSGAPEWVHLLPAGPFGGVDGRGPYHVDDANSVIAASMAATKLVVDVNHATDVALQTGRPAPAQGWITGMEARPDGIWAKVEWTRAGQALHADQAYRGISPVFAHDKQTGAVSRVLRAALTNAPNLPQLATLHTQQREHDMDLATKLRQALGLADAADDAAIIAAATAARTAVSAHAQQLASIAQAAGATADSSAEAIVSAVQARTGGKLDELVALQSQVLTLQTAAKRGAAEAAVDGAIRAGKPIPPASREDVIARHMADPAGTEGWLKLMPSITGGAGFGVRPAVPAAGDAASLTLEDRQVIQMMGLDPVVYARTKAHEAISLGGAA